MVSNTKMEYQVFLCIFQKNLAMATYGLKENSFGKAGKKEFEKQLIFLLDIYI